MATISANRRIGRKPEQAARCRGSKKEQTTFSTAEFVTNGFLKHCFLPLYQPSEDLPDRKVVEKGFFQSLSILTGLYGIKQMNVSDKAYPYNMLLAHWDISQQLKAKHQQIELSIIQDEQEQVQLSTRQTYNTGTTLYYIPVIPLYRLLKDKRQKRVGELFLSVFSYLYRVARVPYYRDNYSALAYYYEMMAEWISDDLDSMEETERNRSLSELNTAQYFGDVMFRRIYNPYHLSHFRERIDNFKPANDFENDCLSMAETAYRLFLQYPKRSAFYHILSEDKEYEEGIIRAEQYISFIADSKGWLYQSIADMVNNEFNECCEMEEPCIVQVFDNNPIRPDEGLDFERRFFPLLDDLCTLLNDIA